MKKLICLALALLLALSLVAIPASADYGDAYYPNYAPILTNLSHNCPNTGVMLPEDFSPYTTTYLLTVANWVSRVSFTPTCADPNATITVNGTVVKSGKASSYIKMDDKPKQVSIVVTNLYGESTEYTVFLQRRPSERRTRVSSGFINSISYKSNKWYIDADLVTVSYSSGNISTYKNSSYEKNKYKYACTDSCVFYYGTMYNPIRATDINEFQANYLNWGSSLYRFIYIEDEIVAVLPYEADY